LLEHHSLKIELLWGTESEKSTTSVIAGAFSPSSLKPAPHVFSVEELSVAFRHSALVIGGDTGVSHLAAALGTPTLMLFLATVGERYTHPDLKNQFFVDARLEPTSPEQVFKKAQLAMEWAKT
jgi:ADP-heptose:LPS heptosyltransferase